MNNYERALEVIEDSIDRNGGRGIAKDIIEALEADGLIAPDLPTPTINSADNPVWSREGSRIELDWGGKIIIDDLYAVPADEVETTALELLAAVKYAKENE